MLKLTLYNYKGDSKVVDKSDNLTELHAVTGVHFLDGTTLDELNLRISEMRPRRAVNANYAKLEDITDEDTKILGYYFLNPPRFINAHQCELSGELDHLMFYKDDILNTEQYITRSEKFRNMYFRDTNIPTMVTYDYIVKPFGKKLAQENAGGTPSKCYILNTSGIARKEGA